MTSPSEVAALSLPELKKLAKSLGVSTTLPLPKLRKAVKTALTESEETKPAAKKTKPGVKPKAKPEPEETEEESEAEEAEGSSYAELATQVADLTSRLETLEQWVTDMQPWIGTVDAAINGTEEEAEEPEGDSEEEEAEEEPAEEEDESEEAEASDDEIPETVRPFLTEQDDGSYRLSLDPGDVDEMEPEVVRDLLTVLGHDVSAIKGTRKLQAKLKEVIEESAVAVEDEEGSQSGADVELTVGMRVAYTDSDGDVFAAIISDTDERGEPDEEGLVRIEELTKKKGAEPSWVMDVDPSMLRVAEE